MPLAPKHPCSQPGCPNLVDKGSSRCALHKQEAWAGAGSRYYSSAEWKRLRGQVLREEPYCRRCSLCLSTQSRRPVVAKYAKLFAALGGAVLSGATLIADGWSNADFFTFGAAGRFRTTPITKSANPLSRPASTAPALLGRETSRTAGARSSPTRRMRETPTRDLQVRLQWRG